MRYFTERVYAALRGKWGEDSVFHGKAQAALPPYICFAVPFGRCVQMSSLSRTEGAIWDYDVQLDIYALTPEECANMLRTSRDILAGMCAEKRNEDVIQLDPQTEEMEEEEEKDTLGRSVWHGLSQFTVRICTAQQLSSSSSQSTSSGSSSSTSSSTTSTSSPSSSASTESSSSGSTASSSTSSTSSSTTSTSSASSSSSSQSTSSASTASTASTASSSSSSTMGTRSSSSSSSTSSYSSASSSSSSTSGP